MSIVDCRVYEGLVLELCMTVCGGLVLGLSLTVEIWRTGSILDC